jgi:hypothetical protein
LFITYQWSFFHCLTDIWKRTIEEEEKGGGKREERRRLEVKRRELDPANLDREGAGVSRHFSSVNDDIYIQLFVWSRFTVYLTTKSNIEKLLF